MPFLQPKINAIRPADTPGTPDRLDADLVHGAPPELLAQLRSAVGSEQVLSRAIDLVRYATDASPYRLLPQAVVVARDSADVAAVFDVARRSKRSLVFEPAEPA